MRPYSEAVKADVRRRMSPPHRQSVAEIAQEMGIHVITLYQWRKAWRLQGEVVPATQKDLEKRHQADQREIKRLQLELRRKDKALAEAAALLIASKKIQAYWGEDAGDDLSCRSPHGPGDPRYRCGRRGTGH